MAGLIFLLCVPSYRRDSLDLFKQQKVAAVGLIAVSKVLLTRSRQMELTAAFAASGAAPARLHGWPLPWGGQRPAVSHRVRSSG
jgi:hypothetical protein